MTWNMQALPRTATDAELIAMIDESTKCLARAQDGLDKARAAASEHGFDDYTETDLRFASTRIDAATILLGIMRKLLSQNTPGNR